ncbi:MFS transporter [Shewanella algidipiscicola]|uniref:MFS transporter n=1 Tax=Shewanella algidipiscicola TaxID=614070 RepID=UPI000D78BA04|nr:MFS transporter [Shewanella algidipiscicola]
MTQLQPAKIATSALVFTGILLISLSLRSPITGIGPLLDDISQQLGISATQAGMLTTLPLLAFALFSPIASSMGKRFGLERSLMTSLVLITLGLTLRSLGSTDMLFIGTTVIGAGIAIANVLLPSLTKRDFADKAATVTSLYVLMMGVGSAIVASIAIPVAKWVDSQAINLLPNWALSLATNLVFPLVAILVWLPLMRSNKISLRTQATHERHGYVWRSSAAWHITLFLALNSFLMYILISWLPSILIDSGFSHEQAGVIHGVLQLATALPALILIPLMAKVQDKRKLTLALTSMALLGIIGQIIAPMQALWWALLMGFGIGGSFIIGLALISLRTANSYQAATLSGMSQCIGYSFAATGPLIMGAMYQQSHDWRTPLLMCAGAAVLWAACSFFAANGRLISKPLESDTRLPPLKYHSE